MKVFQFVGVATWPAEIETYKRRVRKEKEVKLI